MDSDTIDPAVVRRLLVEFEQTQWIPPATMLESQFRQIQRLVQHACDTVPFYNERFQAAGINPQNVRYENFDAIPLLTRQDIQFAGTSLYSQSLPESHRVIGRTATSGSTGRPMLSLSTRFTQHFWNAITIRDHLWHRRELGCKLGVIRSIEGLQSQSPQGDSLDHWGASTIGLVSTGSCSVLDIHHTIDEQAVWLAREDPDYVLTHPSNALALAHYWLIKSLPALKLREVRTFGEHLDDRLRTACREAWGAPVIDLYSAAETGYLALQCPNDECYHVQSEAVFLEILDEAQRPCAVGRTGRVVVTVLTNYAMPLIRYELGDYAAFGGNCSCRRTLPVLKHIVGRQRNMCILPDGRRRWPSLGTDTADKIDDFPPIQQFQLVQQSRRDLELFLVMHRPMSEAEECLIRSWVTEAVGHPFDLKVSYVEKLHRGAGGKFEDFLCNLAEGD